jgi:hypothetical protein
MSVTALEIHTDVVGGRSYASRNMAHLQHVYKAPTVNGSTFEWCNTLRQVRAGQLTGGKTRKNQTQSMPDLRTAERQTEREPLVGEHPEGPYLDSSKTVAKYQNYAQTRDIVNKRMSRPTELDWILNLRDGTHAEDPSAKWRRFHTRPQQSFDMMQENCAKTNEVYQTSHITPQDRRIDRRAAALPHANIRADPISFRRWEGCEGTNVNLWQHMIMDHRRGYKSRGSIKAETTIRGSSDDPNGARVSDIRTDGCIVEMLGKKRWNGAQHHDSLHARPPHGDARLHYLSQIRPGLEPDEENRAKRMSKQPRTDAGIPEVRAAKSATLGTD